MLHPPKDWAPMTCPGGVGKRGIIHWATSLTGPWTSVGPARINLGPDGPPPNSGLSNPAPYIFPNGTVLLVGRGQDVHTLPNNTRIKGHNIWLFRANSWIPPITGHPCLASMAQCPWAQITTEVP
eukprot:TRINITY_DN8438_c0_g1_i1.p3 TRINITY_DN8438_c0_g1~~TRINITY_DN8438_c0_g1_i1.p3  ORF type:complete len:125 (+),score=7.27 TRINITY_DN8438_c0_g1_i1:539-913(+)